MILIELFISFFKVGIVGFGGGYAMIPLIQSQVISHNWLSQVEFLQILAIAEMTPGPVSINTATYVGFKTSGLLGAAISTLGVAAPSLIILISIGGFLFKNYKHPLIISVLSFYKTSDYWINLCGCDKNSECRIFW